MLKRLFVSSITIFVFGCIASAPPVDPAENLSIKENKATSSNSSTSSIDQNTPEYKDWYTQVSKQIEKEEYQPTLQDKDSEGKPFTKNPKWHLANRKQGFRSYVDNSGWEIKPREIKKGEKGWFWHYQFVEISREISNEDSKNLHQAKNAETVEKINNEIHLQHSPEFTEWYKNSQAGIEQGFKITKKPELNTNRELIIKGQVSTDLKVNSFSKEQVTFSTAKADVLRYGGLKVIDANGTQLKSWMSFNKQSKITSSLNLHIDDSKAVYPIVVDPLATSAAWTAESDQANAQFGFSVSTAGDVNGDGYSDVIVGANMYDGGQENAGRAFVYHGSASGLSVTANWTAEADQTSANFAWSVSTAGDVNGDGYSDVIVGAPYYSNGQSIEGRAYVYHGSSSGLSTTANSILESDQAGAWFGYSVSTAGDVNGDGYSDIIVGSPYYSNGQTEEGRTFVYHGSSSGLSTTAAWTVESDQASAHFGNSVSTAGDVNGDGYSDVIVGANKYDTVGFDDGRAYVYHGSSSGLSTTAAWITESNNPNFEYGYSVSTAGDVNGDGYSDVIVGEYFYGNGQEQEGRAYVYHGSSSGLSTTAAWTVEPNVAYSYFGVSVSTAGDVNGDGYSDVIVGSYGYDNGQAYEGRAYVYQGSASGLSTTAAWTAESDQAYSESGRSVSTAGDVNGDGYSDVIVGAYLYNNGQSDEGRTFVYHGSSSGLSTTSNWTTESDQADAQFGFTVSTAGDVNGDGYSDVIVGANFYDNGQTNEGRAYVYQGSSSGLSTTAAWTAESDLASVFFGWSVSTAGDVNGDGYSDVIIGANLYSNGQTNEGRAYVYQGSSSGLSTTAAWTAESNQASATFGSSVSTAGDVNGDGYSDVIVGAYHYNNGQTDEGRVFVYQGSASGLSTTAAWTAESDQAGAYFGYSVSTAGDVNGDGYSDVIVGAFGYDNGQADEGRAYVYHGSASGLSTTAAWTAESDQAGAYFGGAASTAGDVNGDGYSDVIVGAHAYSNGQSDEGRAFVYHGSSSGLSTTAAWTTESNQVSAEFGSSVSTAGDVNGDGYSDVIVGAPYYNNGQSDEGRAYVYQGSASGLSTTAAWTAESDQTDAYFGNSVSTAGDVNGDGYSDVIVGAEYYDNGQSNEGRAFAYYGNSGAGLSTTPRQLKSDNSPLQVLDGTDSSSFKIRLKGRSYIGRTKARLVWENKALGTSLNNTSLGRGSSWTDIGVAGTDITETVSGLSTNTSYHWRVRLQYFPYLDYSPWYSIGNNGNNESDLRYYVADTTAPTVTNVTSSTTNGSYKFGDAISIQVVFSEAVTVTGTPQLTLETGSTDRTINYVSGSGGTTLTFTYTVQAGDTSSDLDYVSTSALALNSGTIKDPSLNNATLTLVSPGASGSLGNNKALIVDTTAPTVSITSSASNPTNTSPIPVTITFSESVTGFVVGDITVGNGTAGNFAGSGTTYTADITPSGQGAVTVDVSSSVAADTAGNNNTAATQLPRTYDTVAPTVSLTSSASNPTNTSPIPVTITFSESVTGFVVGDITVGNGTAGNFSGSGTTYTADITPSAQGVVTVDVSSSVATDTAGNNNTAATQLSRTYDSIAPTVSITSSASSPTNTSPIPVTITFSESVTGFVVGDITVENGTAGNFAGSGTTYTADITPSAQGAVTVDVSSSVAVDTAGNNNTAAAQLSRTYDSTAPTVSITSSASSPTNTSPIPVTITFSESVTGFVVGDITVGNGTAGNFAGSGTTYTADITPSGQGAVTVDVSSSVAIDTAGNGNSAATQLSITYDSTASTVTNVTSSTANGTYKAGNVISIQIVFSEVVTVTGTPQLTLETGASDAVVNYASGSGTNTLTFTYTISSGHSSFDLVYQNANSLALNSGTITDGALNNATLTLPTPGSVGSLGNNKDFIIDTTAPFVTITSSASNPTGTSPIPITITFSECVTGFVVGDITVGNGTAGSFSGSCNVYTANVTPTTDGVVTVDVGSSVAVDNPGNGNTAATQLTRTYDSTAPTVSNVTSSTTNGSYKAGDAISIQVVFSEAVTVTGTPQLTLETGSTDRTINYVSGSGGTTLTFTYTVQAGDNSADLDYVGTSSLALNSGTIRDTVLNNATLTLANPGASGSLGNNKALVIDTTAPTVSITSSASNPTNTSPIPVTFTFNESVTGFVVGDLTVGNGTAGNFAGSGTTYTADITPTAQGAVTVDVGSAAAADTVGNNNTAATQFSITYDSTIPTVTNVTSSTANGSYKAGDAISIQVVFSEAVTATGTPQLTLETGSTDRTINYVSGSGGTTLTFTYTVQAGDISADLDYVGTNSLVLNSGSIRDAALNNATLTLASPGASGSLGNNKALVIDTIAPTVSIASSASNPTNTSPIPVTFTFNESVTGFVVGDITVGNGTAGNFSGSGTTYTADITPSAQGAVTVDVSSSVAADAAANGNTAATQLSRTYDSTESTVSSVTSSTANGSYKSGDAISIQVVFSEAVTVTGTPQLTLETGTTDRTINYVSGSGGTTLTFTYTVQAGDTSADLNYVATSSLALNSGTIRDAALNNATLTLASPGASGSLGNNKALVIDTTAPTVSITSSASNPTNISPIPVTITFSESVTGFVVGDITVGNGTAGNFAGSGTTYTADITPSAQGAVTVDVSSSVATDTAGNNNTAATQLSRTYDSTAPTVMNVTSSSSNGSYKAGNSVSIQVVFSEAVTVTGTPQLNLETGSTDRTINYVSGSGGATLTFTYTVQAGDTSSDLDYVGTTSLALNGGTICNAGSNNATLTLVAPGASGSLGANKAIIIDTTATTVTITSSASGSTHSSPIPITITFSEAVTGFVIGDITVANGTVGSFTGSGTTYTAEITPTADGTVIVNIASAVAADTAGNSNSSASQFSVDYDSSVATPTITTGSGTRTSYLGTVEGTAEVETTVEVFDNLVSIGTVDTDDSGDWSLSLSTPLDSGSHSLTAKATDSGNNDSASSVAVLINILGTVLDFDNDGISDVSLFKKTKTRITMQLTNSSDSSLSLVDINKAYAQPAPGDYNGNGKTEVAVLSKGAKNVLDWSFVDEDTGAVTTESFGKFSDYVITGCNFDSSIETEMAYIRKNALYFKHHNSSSVTKKALPATYKPETLLGCGDLNQDGVSELLFEKELGKKKNKTYNFVAINLSGQIVKQLTNVGNLRLAYVEDATGDETADLLFKIDKQRTLDIWDGSSDENTADVTVGNVDNFSIGISQNLDNDYLGCLINVNGGNVSKKYLKSGVDVSTDVSLGTYLLAIPVNVYKPSLVLLK